MTLGLRERLELIRQGIIRGYIIPGLEEKGYMVTTWKRPISLEDMVLKDGGWRPIYTQFTSWETYAKDHPLHVYFNTFYGDLYEKAYRICFIEYLISVKNLQLPPRLIGIFTRLNLPEGGYYWKHRISVDLNFPDTCIKEIDATYDELLVMLDREGLLEVLEEETRRAGQERKKI
jgi:hypothetical protein